MSELEVELISVLDDNYVFRITHVKTRKTALVDPGDAGPCLKSLKEKGLGLDFVLITHHHADHIDGIAELKSEFASVQVYAPLKNQKQISGVDHWVQETDCLRLEGLADFQVWDMPGHTLGHVAYWQAQQKWLFSGDVLFGLGCGRLFEGTSEMMFETLNRIKKLPAETEIFCTHEYSESNFKFALELIESKRIPEGFDFQFFKIYQDKLLQKRNRLLPSVPLLLSDELRCNSFLLAQNANELGALRLARNTFKPKRD